ncbi:protein-L-isoaspartate(D-aspartate) O-methyltransferase [Streptomyces tateyamensis]|uniref:Protein-L-isoaspartate O-methyltransferase n=1 Tax=Streptomyces tateyamensis TaxID=565073 RepID=A0A2V4N5P7_9ACTN|nr:methyltransferase domain-containing protein [Streptomyces tateyamensis]PYC76861.1 protein-L-isoaspartate(D-aspartate) O-methyltransferase [Streptomyces tateyamensis]
MTWDELTDGLRRSGVLSEEWEVPFRALPRSRFTPARIYHAGEWIDQGTDPARWCELVCTDQPLVTQLYEGTEMPSSSSSMPTVVATMLHHLDVADRTRVLEVGTGTGWTAALLSHRLGGDKVVSIEVDPELAAQARARLDAMGLRPRVVTGDGMIGDPAGAPFQRIHLTAAVQRVPGALIEQCEPGGVILAPYGTALCNGALARLTVAADGRSAAGPFVADVAFMWVRDQRPDSGEFSIDTVRYSASEVDPADFADNTDAAFAIGLRVPGLFRQSVWASYDRFGTGRFEVWDGTSYAHCRLADWLGDHAVSQSGPRNLWEEVTAAYRWWQHRDRPHLSRLGLTVTVAGEHRAWLDEPGNVIG